MTSNVFYWVRIIMLMVLLLLDLPGPVRSAGLRRIPVDRVSDPQTTGYPDSRKIVRDSRDNVYLAYRKKGSDGMQHIYVARLRKDARSFTNLDEPVETVLLPYTQRVPSLTIDEHDILHVVWYGLDDQNRGDHDRQIRYTRSQRPAYEVLTWAPVVTPAEIAGYAEIAPSPFLWQEHPAIFAGPEQTLYVVWEGKDRDHPHKAQVKFIWSQDGGATWSAWQNIPGDPNLYYSRPTILTSAVGRQRYALAYATAPNGVAQLVWTQSLTDGDPGVRWEKWRFVSDSDGDGVSDSTQDQRHLSVVMDTVEMDGQGQLHLVWRQRPEGALGAAKTQIHYARFSEQGAWSPSRPLLPNPATNQSFPSLTVDKDNRLWAVWSESPTLPGFPNEEPVTGEIRAAKQPLGGNWQPTGTPVLSAGVNALYPTLRWRRYGSKYGVDLAWVETTASSAAENICVEDAQVKCMIYYTNLAGQ